MKTRIEKAVQENLLSESAKSNILQWLDEERYAAFREELTAEIEKEAWESLNDGFYQVMPFGTGGRRGAVGIGPNRMNAVTIAEGAQGVADSLKKLVEGRRAKVVVAYDTRLTSAEFTLKTAEILAGNDIEVYLFDGPRATPELSFMVRDLKADAGIVISASHNPPEDNGFKAYYADGGQVVPPKDKMLIEAVKNVKEIRALPFEEAYGKGLIKRLTKHDEERYYAAVLKQALTHERALKIVYSPIHGTGVTSILPILRKAGFEDIHLVESQKDPDGRFPNVPGHKPNPEVKTGLDASIALAKAIGADVAMASDPDADRLAAAVPAREAGEYVVLSGNQCAAMMMEFIALQMKQQGSLKASHRVYTTCVSSPLMPTIARSYGLTVEDTLLVGFKWIAERIEAQENPDDFLFGSEESIGFMKGAQTRDKDGAAGALIMAEVLALAKAEGKSALDYLDDIYRKYGYFADLGDAVYLEGAKGSERMARIMAALRETPPTNIGGYDVALIMDRLKNEFRKPDGKVVEPISGPTNNLLQFYLREDRKTWIAVRPSGTEPKIKFYISAFEQVSGDLEQAKQKAQNEAKKLLEAIKALAMRVE